MKRSSTTEKQLLKALSHDDSKAFDYIFRSYYPKIKGFLSGLLETTSEAEDLAQDVFVKLWQHRISMEFVENLNAYLYKIAKNILFDHIARTTPKSFSSLAYVEDIPTTEKLEELLFAKELEDLINIAIEKMPPQRQKIFLLSRKEGVSNEEIALRLQISKRTVETHISAALADLRKIFFLLLVFF